jgi:hypothetical protein
MTEKGSWNDSTILVIPDEAQHSYFVIPDGAERYYFVIPDEAERSSGI